MPRISIYLPGSPDRPPDFVRYAALAARTGAARLWLGQSFTFDNFQGLAHAARAGYPVAAGTGVALMPLCHPLEAAARARSAAASTGLPFTAGFGPATPAFQRMLTGSAYASPLTAVREYLAIAGGLVRGEEVAVSGSHFSLHSPAPPMEHPPVEVAVGVLRPRMAALAGECADAAVTWLVPPEHLSEVLVPASSEGAAAAGRRPPRYVAAVSAAVRKRGQDPRRLALLAHDGHLRGAHYQAVLTAAGISADPDQPASAARALLDSGLFLWGSTEEIAAGVRGYLAAGADEVALYFGGQAAVSPPDETAADIESVLAELVPPAGAAPAASSGAQRAVAADIRTDQEVRP